MNDPLLEPSPKLDAAALADRLDEAREALSYGDTATARGLLRAVAVTLREIAEAERRAFGESPP